MLARPCDVAHICRTFSSCCIDVLDQSQHHFIELGACQTRTELVQGNRDETSISSSLRRCSDWVSEDSIQSVPSGGCRVDDGRFGSGGVHRLRRKLSTRDGRVAGPSRIFARSQLGLRAPAMRTLNSFGIVVGLGLAAAALAPSAHAADWSVAVGIGLPGVVVVSPPPAYVRPPPGYYVPPGYVPGYYPPPGYYQPPTVIGYRDRDGDYYRHREWHHHYHHHHDDDDE